MPVVIAIDGPAAAGKGTLARALAAFYGFDYLDTGLLYRAVGMKGGDPVVAANGLTPADLARPDLRSEPAARAASEVAAIPEVRAALIDFQRAFAASPPSGNGAVLDGRDIGTVICPGATVKLFVTASAEVRAGRRYHEVLARDGSADFESILADVKARDARDAARIVAPLVAAHDAHLLDTSNLDIEAALRAARAIIDGAIEHGREGAIS